MYSIELLSISLLVAVFSGISMGLYLAAVNGFTPARHLSRTLVTSAVAGLSFFIPLAVQQALLGSSIVVVSGLIPLVVLYFMFAAAADLTNFIVCKKRKEVKQRA